jgi:hypothetical protein
MYFTTDHFEQYSYNESFLKKKLALFGKHLIGSYISSVY